MPSRSINKPLREAGCTSMRRLSICALRTYTAVIFQPHSRPNDVQFVHHDRKLDVTSDESRVRRRVDGHDNDWSYGGLRTSDGGYEH